MIPLASGKCPCTTRRRKVPAGGVWPWSIKNTGHHHWAKTIGTSSSSYLPVKGYTCHPPVDPPWPSRSCFTGSSGAGVDLWSEFNPKFSHCLLHLMMYLSFHLLLHFFNILVRVRYIFLNTSEIFIDKIWPSHDLHSFRFKLPGSEVVPVVTHYHRPRGEGVALLA